MDQLPVMIPPRGLDIWKGDKQNQDVMLAKEILVAISDLLQRLPEGWKLELRDTKPLIPSFSAMEVEYRRDRKED